MDLLTEGSAPTQVDENTRPTSSQTLAIPDARAASLVSTIAQQAPHTALNALALDQATQLQEMGMAKREGFDPRVYKTHRYFIETYDISDESTPEGVALATIGHRLEGETPFKGKIKYRIINNNTLNAFALGDTVYVYSGLLSKLQNTSEVASILAHEITHVEKGDTAISDSTTDPDSVYEIVRKFAILRIQEYTADAMVAEKLDQAGFNPTSYYHVMDMLQQEAGDNGVDFAHGFAKDRQSAQLLQMRLKDYESTAKQDTEQKPPELTEAYLAPKYKAQLFERLYELAEHGSDAIVQQELQRLSPSAILDFHSYLGGRMSALFERKGNARSTPQPSVHDLTQVASLMGLTDIEVERRINQAFPQATQVEKYQMQVALYTEVQDRKFGELQKPADFLEYAGLQHIARTVDYARKLKSTLNTEADILAFAQLTKDPSILAQLGYDVAPSEFPRRVFSLFPNSWQIESMDMFFLDTLKKLYPQPTTYKASFDFIEKVGVILGAESQEDAKNWTNIMLREVKDDALNHYIKQVQQMDPHLFDLDTPAAVLRYAPQIEPQVITLQREFFTRVDKYRGDKYRDDFTEDSLRMTAGRLYSDLPYEQKQEYESAFVVNYLRSEDPRLDKFMTLFETKDTQSVVDFLRQNGAEAFIAYSRTAKISRQDIPYAYQVLNEVQQVIQSEYVPTQKDQEVIVKLISDTKLITPELQRLQEEYKAGIDTVPPKQLLRELGIGEKEMRLILNIQLSQILTYGGNEDKAYAEYEKLVSSLPLSELSQSGAMIIYDQLLSFGISGGHALASYKERHYELDWGKALRLQNFTTLKDMYFYSWQRSGAPLNERIKHVRALSEKLTEFGNKQAREPDANWLGSNQEVALYVSPLVKNVMTEAASLEINKRSIDDLKVLHELVGVFDDKRLASRLRSEIELQIVQLMIFEEATDYIKDLLDNNAFPLKAIDWYQEHLIRTKDQLQKAQSLMDDYFDKVHSRGDERIAVAAGIDYVFENFITDHSLEVFEAALESQHDDTKLRTLLAQFWYSSYMPNMTTPYRLNIPTAQNDLTEVTISGGAQHQFVPFERFVDSFYQKLGQTEVDILLRKMLISRKGVLMTPQGRDRLHNILMNQISAGPQDANLRNLIDQIVGNGLDVVDPAKLYQPLASILRERMFMAPSQPGSNQGAVEYVWKKYTDGLNSYLEIIRDSVSRAKTTYKRNQSQDKYREAQQYVRQHMPTQEDMGRVIAFNPLSSRQGLSDTLNAIERAKDRVTALVGLPERGVKMEQLEPIEVVLEFSRNMGAVGVRFLQLLGQYVDIPDRYQAKFDEVYDQVRGQLKYTAYLTLRREATKEGASPALQSFWKNMNSLGPKDAGGSVMTVYRAQMNDGSEKIVKVLNPNAELLIRSYIADMKAVIAKMQEQKPSPTYELTAILILDLEEWLVEDINTTSYEQNNAVFEATNNGFVVQTTSGQQITVASPETTQTGTKYIKIEQLVDGRNLSDLLRVGEQAAKPYVEATIASFKHQTETPAEDGEARVHSDVHIGNVRIGNDGKLYWIDRGYYLEMSTQEVAIIKPLLEGQFDPMIGMQAIGYLLGLPENQALSAQLDMNQLFGDIIGSVIEAKGKGQSNLMVTNNVLLTLKGRGIHIPIRFSLFFKNVRAQAKMAERVGVPYP